ncbi:MAG: DNA-directed RNA polymerase subunit omega [Synergistaceae bacterium]|jgi:DNA-directed RNA polymerase omega subunit|nr:DNA-directed RNA polymerase subunit omega [Synergistaceae bacterium]
MIYNNLEQIYETSHVDNKYALAMVVSTRARQLSEQKGRALEGAGSERYITHAIEEIEFGQLNIDTGVTKASESHAAAVGA